MMPGHKGLNLPSLSGIVGSLVSFVGSNSLRICSMSRFILKKKKEIK